MENIKETKPQKTLKQQLIDLYRNGKLSLTLLGLMSILVLVILVGRVMNASLLKELSIIPFNLNPNLTQSYSQLSTFNMLTFVLVILTWIVLILYFVAWFLFKKINFNALIIYTLLGFVLASGLYLFTTQPLSNQINALDNLQACAVEPAEGEEKPAYCENQTITVEKQLVEMGENVNNNYFLSQTAFLAMVFFLVLSILQLLMDRVKKLIVIKKGKVKGEVYEQATI